MNNDYVNTKSATFWIAVVNLGLAAVAYALPPLSAPGAGAALKSFMTSPEYIAGVGSLVAITLRAAIERKK